MFELLVNFLSPIAMYAGSSAIFFSRSRYDVQVVVTLG